MFLTRMELDASRRNTMKALASPNIIHGTIERAFPGPRERRLWRVDRISGNFYLLLLSRTPPDLSAAMEQFGPQELGATWECRAYEPFLARLTEGSRCRFRLAANPTWSCKSDDGESRGTVRAHTTPEHQAAWLMRKCEGCGFSLAPEQFASVSSRWLRFRKGGQNGHTASMLEAVFDGILTITDAPLFRRTLTEGIGRGKAFGMGLMTVARTGGNG